MPTVYLSLGSNMRAEENFALAISELHRRFSVRDKSPVYSNEPLGFSGNDFLNAVVRVETALNPFAVCDHLEEIHVLAGRSRDENRFQSRTLDIDLLLYDDLIIDLPTVVIPRADVLQYSFVLKPLCDIAPDLLHPETGRTMAAHWGEFDTASHQLTKTDIVL